MFKKITFIILFSSLIILSFGCENSRSSSGNGFILSDPCNTENNDIPQYNNDFFYLFSDNAKITDDSAVYYANGLVYDGGFSGTATSQNVENCIIDGNEAVRIKRTGESWSAGGWVGLADQPLDLSSAENLVFYVKADPGQVNGSLFVKMESLNGAYGLNSGFGPDDADGSWKKIEIPLSTFSDNGIDLTEVKSPFIYVLNEMDINDVIYIDCIYFDGPVKSPGKISLDHQSYSITETEAKITVIDPVSTGQNIDITVSNGTETIQIEDVPVDENGKAEVSLNFGTATDGDTNTIAISIGDTITVNFTDAGETLQSDAATIVPEGTLEGDTNFDGKVYIYSSTEPVDLLRNQDYQTHHWDTFSTFKFNFTSDSDLSPVISVQSGTGWGGTPTCIAFHSFEISLNKYTNINFKFKSEEYSTITIKLPGSTLDSEQVTYDMTDFEIIDGTNGWHKVRIPLSDFKDVSASDTVGFFHNGDPGSFFLTDIYFD